MNPFFINRIKEVLMGQESLNRLAQDFGLIHVVKKDQRTSMNLMILALVDLIKTQKVKTLNLFLISFN